jgi:hypothetical protein
MILSLKSKFDVNVLTPYYNDESLNKSNKYFSEKGINYIGLEGNKFDRKVFKKRFLQISEKIFYFFFGIDQGYTNGLRYRRKILSIINDADYDFVISNYWEFSVFFEDIRRGKPIKILDTHYAVKENIEVIEKNNYKHKIPFFKKRELGKSLDLERRAAQSSDIIISLSEKSEKIFRELYPGKEHVMIPDGSDIDYFSSKMTEPEPNTLLFYGNMASYQNQGAFRRFIKCILPNIKKEIPGTKVIVVGDNPPRGILNLNEENDFLITGFVEDVREWICKGVCMIDRKSVV